MNVCLPKRIDSCNILGFTLEHSKNHKAMVYKDTTAKSLGVAGEEIRKTFIVNHN